MVTKLGEEMLRLNKEVIQNLTPIADEQLVQANGASGGYGEYGHGPTYGYC